jgi:hypothetical protein
MNPFARKRFYPDRDQLLLLEICLLRDPEAARRAWKKWKERVDLDDLDPSSFRIMSLVYRRMVELGIDDPDAGRIKGLYRYHWTRNQLAWRGKDRILRTLGDMGIDTLLLKGAALSRTVYPEPATRGMHDLDILVPVSGAKPAMDLLRSEGWIAQHFAADQTIELFHGCSFVHPEFGELDLHWHAMRSGCRVDSDDALWAAVRPIVANGIPTKVLCPADLFLHACEHGMNPSHVSAMQWMVDATFIIRHSPAPFDWERLIDQARKFRLVIMVRRTLGYIRDHFEPSIPAEVIRRLNSTPTSPRDHFAYLLAGHIYEDEGRFYSLGLAGGYYLNLTEGRPFGERLRGFPLYYRLYIHEKRLWRVVFDEETRTFEKKFGDDVREFGFRAKRLLCFRSRPHGGLITHLPKDRLHRFYPVEREFGSPFRWSEIEAAIDLEIARQPQVFRLALKPFRDLTRLLEDDLVMRVNGHRVPPSSCRLEGTFLYFSVEADCLKESGLQRLSWTIRAWPAPGDPRQLGLPLSRLWTYPGKLVPRGAKLEPAPGA